MAGLLTAGFPPPASALSTTTRTFSRDLSRTNSPIIVTVTFTNADAGSYRGFYYTEQLPSGLSVTPLAVSLNGTPISNYTFETGLSGDVYPGCTPQRWILETPPAFAESNPVTLSGQVQITYSINSSSAGLFRLQQFSWTALDADTNTAAFGTSAITDQHTVAFLATTNPVPTGAIWTLWWQQANGSLARWSMVGDSLMDSSYLHAPNPGSFWSVRANSDLNGDGEEDLLFQSADGQLAAWTLDDTSLVAATYLNPPQAPSSWNLMVASDINGDGQKDLFFENAAGNLQVWLMSGTNRTQTVALNPPSVGPDWRLAGAGNFLGSAQPQLLWQSHDGWLALWSMNGTNLVRATYLNPPRVDPSWKVCGTVDLNGDGGTEILWRGDSGGLAYWVMNGTNLVRAAMFNPTVVDPAWRIVGSR